MCHFQATVTLCACKDPECRFRTPALGQLENTDLKREGGHIQTVDTYFRQGPLCMDHFVNNDPLRVLVCFGMDPNNPNSKQDCTKKTVTINPKMNRGTYLCNDCKNFCFQPQDSLLYKAPKK